MPGDPSGDHRRRPGAGVGDGARAGHAPQDPRGQPAAGGHGSGTTSARSAATLCVCCFLTPTLSSSSGRPGRGAPPRAEFGFGHALRVRPPKGGKGSDQNSATLGAAPRAGDRCITEEERRRPCVRRRSSLPASAGTTRIGVPRRGSRRAGDHAAEAQALVRTAIEVGVAQDELRRSFLCVVADHHLGYGHGVIYVQKAFELCDRIRLGPARYRPAPPRAHLPPGHDAVKYLFPYMPTVRPCR